MLRLCAVLLAYNKSSGYRWSAIPKPPPRGVDRLYGTHSVLSTLRVFAQGQYKASDVKASAEEASRTAGTVQALETPSSSAAAAQDVPRSSAHPYRQSLLCLYVRDFSLDETTASSSNGKPGRAASSRAEKEKKGGEKGGRPLKVIPARYSTVHRIVALAKFLGVPVKFVPRAELVQLCGERRNQHVVLEVSSFTPTPIHSLVELFANELPERAIIKEGENEAVQSGSLSNAASPLSSTTASSSSSSLSSSSSPRRRVVVYLDHIVDPTNVGNILRTAYFNGVDDLILSADSASCTPAVSRTSTGFLEYMRVFQATSPTAVFLQRSHDDWQRHQEATTTAATTADPSLVHSRDASTQLDVIATTTTEKARAVHRAGLHDAPSPTLATLTTPCGHTDRVERHVQVLLLGNEDRGLSDDVVRRSTHTMHIQSLRQERLSAAAAAGAAASRTALERAAGADAQDGQEEKEKEPVLPVGGAPPVLDYTVRRLWRLRPQEVTLNVNAACSAMLCLLTSEAYQAHIHPIAAASASEETMNEKVEKVEKVEE